MSAPVELPAEPADDGAQTDRDRPALTDVSHGTPGLIAHRLNGREFRQRETHLSALNKEGEEYQIMPGRLSVSRVAELRDVGRDLAPAEVIETLFSVTYEPPRAEVRSAVVTDRDMRSREPRWPQETGVGGVVSTRGIPAVSDAIRAAGMTVRYESGVSAAYGVPGLLLRPDRPPVFLRQGMPALTADGVGDETALCELPPQVLSEDGIRVLGLDDPSNDDQYADDMASLLRFLDVCPADPAIPVALLAQLTYAPWAGLPGVPHLAVAVAGDTGMRKSAMAGIITGAQSRDWVPVDGDADKATVNVRHGASSKLGIDRLLYHLAGTVGVVDDAFAGNLSAADVRTQWIMLSGVAQSMATQKGGTKATRDGVGIRTDRFPRCCLLVTAEDYPDEDQHGSEIARYLALRATDGAAVDTAVLTEVQQSIRAASRAHARMIQDGLTDLTRPARAIAWARDQVDGWERNGHPRARSNATLAVAGARLLADHWGRALDAPADAWAAMWVDVIHDAADAQARRCGMTLGGQAARNPVALFVRRFREMLRDGTWYLASATRGPDFAALAPTLPGYGPAAVGWRQGAVIAGETAEGTQWFPAGKGDPVGAVRIWGGTGRRPWREVMALLRSTEWDDIADTVRRRVRERDGWSMPAAGDLLRMLSDDGWMKARTSERDSLWSDAPDVRVLKFDLGRLLGIEDQGDADDVSSNDGGDAGSPPPVPDAPAPDSSPLSTLPGMVDSEAPSVDPDEVEVEEPPGASTPDDGAPAGVSTGPCLACGGTMWPHVPGDGVYADSDGTYRQAHPACELPEPAPVAEPRPMPTRKRRRTEPVPASGWEMPDLTDKAIASLRRTLTEVEWEGPNDHSFVVEVAGRLTAALPLTGSAGRGDGRGLVWAEGRGLTGYRLFRMVQSRAPRRLPPDERIVDVVHPVPAPAATWSRPLTPDEQRCTWWVRFDINGQYLAAASTIPLGTGRPMHFQKKTSIIPKVPANYRLTLGKDAATFAPTIVHGDGWYSAPAAVLLSEHGHVLSVDEAYVWTDHSAWLDRWYRSVRDARTLLHSGTSPVDAAALAALKSMYATFLGGWLASEKYNTTPLYRPDWRDHIRDRAAANQTRALDDVKKASGRTPFATYKDAAYFAVESPDEIPEGLVIDPRLGKWKREAAGDLSPRVLDALNGSDDLFRILRESIREGE